MPTEDAIARFSRRAAELRTLAVGVDHAPKRDGYIAAAKTYESLAASNMRPFLIVKAGA
jgi:hypothetical protein